MEKATFGKSWFLAYLSLCESYLKLQDQIAICDKAIEAVMLNSNLSPTYSDWPEIASHTTILDRVLVMTQIDMVQLMRETSDKVCITCGTQYGLHLDKAVKDGLKDGALIGVASASAHNSGYAGLTLHEWENGNISRKIIKFYGGSYEKFI
jgi:hypothetical protein